MSLVILSLFFVHSLSQRCRSFRKDFDFFIYCFTTPVWAEFHRVKEDVLLKILDIIESHEAQVAFPTSTLHLPDALALRRAQAGEREPGPESRSEQAVDA